MSTTTIEKTPQEQQADALTAQNVAALAAALTEQQATEAAARQAVVAAQQAAQRLSDLSKPPASTLPEVQAVPSDYEALYKAQRDENERLQAVITATRSSVTPAPQSAKAPVSAERLRSTLGPLTLLRMSRAEKLQSIGVDPASVTDDGLHKLFGRGNDGKAAAELSKVNPGRYALLREAADLLRLYAA